ADRGNAAIVDGAQQPLQRLDQLTANSAADAAGGELDDALFGVLDQKMIDPDLAELVDDDRRSGQSGLAHEAVEECGLAGSEEPGDESKRNRQLAPARRGTGRGRTRHCTAWVAALTTIVFAFGAAAGLTKCAGRRRGSGTRAVFCDWTG